MLPDFNRLRVFFHVRATGSVSAAAAELRVTQSAVSQSLAKLESELGSQLFVRRHRRLVPTPAAEALFEVVAPFVHALDQRVQRIDRERQELVGLLRIGAPVELGAHRLPGVLASFRAENPGVRFSLRLGHPSLIVPALEDGQLEMALADLYGDDGSRYTGLQVLGVLDEALVMVAAPDYEQRMLGGSRALAKLQAASFVAYRPQAPAVRQWFRHHFGKQPARLEVGLTVESVQAVITAVEHGMGLGLVPRPSAAEAERRGAVVVVRTRTRALTNRVSLLRVLDRVPTRVEREFVRHLIRQLGVANTEANTAAKTVER